MEEQCPGGRYNLISRPAHHRTTDARTGFARTVVAEAMTGTGGGVYVRVGALGGGAADACACTVRV
eukprot:scaffold226467_cov31-Tisochrysis_lutea.AAC.1